MKVSAVEMSQWAVIFSLVGGIAFPAQSQTQSITPTADGTGTVVNPNGSRIDITGGSLSRDGANLFHSFQRFGLSQGQVANFLSNPNIRNILGRVTGGEASYINGLIQVTGGYSNLFLMNPAGIVFGPNASLNVPAAFTATTASGIGFNSGWFNANGANDYAALVGTPSAFIFSAGQPGAIVNAGNLTLQPGENLTLLGGTVTNTGTLSSPGGNITIAAVPGANTVRISQAGHLLSLEMQPLPATAASGVSIDPLSLPQLLAGGGSESHATGLSVNENGQVFLTGSGIRVPAEGGVALASGTIDASGQTAGAVNVLGDKVGLIGSHINASGSNSGGTVLIGGDYQGKGAVPNATRTFVSSDSTINASALDNGNGGKIIVWADKTTAFYGNINALGGTNGGNGGFVEVSGKENLIFRGSVNLSAPNGTTGSLLLDPENITIVAGSGAAEDSEVASDSKVLFGDGTSSYTISKTALENLDGNAEVKLEASNDIIIQPLSDSQLTLAAGTGSITFTADADQSGVGAFSMSSTDTIRAEGRDVTISAVTITLGNIDTSSAASDGGAITLNALSDIVTSSLRSSAGGSGNGGAIALSSTAGAINTTAGILDSSSYSGNGGDITLTAGGNLLIGNIKSGSVGDSYIIDNLGVSLSSDKGVGRGGNITLNSSGGAVDTTSGKLLSYSVNGKGGNIILFSAKDIRTAAVISSSSGYYSTAESPIDSDSPNGGDITLTSSSGGIDTSLGELRADSVIGDSGSISLDADGDIKTSDIWSGSGLGLGGNITLTSRNGSIYSDALFYSFSSSGQGGAVRLEASGNIYINMIKSGSDSGTGGTIAIESKFADINTIPSILDSSSESGTGGNITFFAAGLLSTGNIKASGALQGGNVTLSSRYSNVDTSSGTLDVSSAQGTAGNIGITSYAGSISIGNISGSKNIAVANGGSDNPLSSAPDASITSDADNINNLSGSVTLSAHNDITVSEPISTSSISSLQLRAGRSITINADINTSGGNGNITLRANDSGADITWRDSGAGNLTMAPDTSLNAGSGNITIELGTLAEVGTITLANLNTAGTVSVNAANGNVLRASDNSLITAGAGIFQTSGSGSLGLPTQPLRIHLNNLEASAGSGGAFFDSPSRGVTLGGVTSLLPGITTFNGGNFKLSASGDIVVTEAINTYNQLNAGYIELVSTAGSIDTTASTLLSYSSTGDAGSVSLTASGDIQTGSISSDSPEGDAGSVSLTASGNIKTYESISAHSSGGRGGNIAINSSNGSIDTSSGFLSTFATPSDSGAVSLTASGDIKTGLIVSQTTGNGRGGDIVINSTNGAIDTSSDRLDSASWLGDAGSVTLAARGDIKTSLIRSLSLGEGRGGDITIHSSQGAIETTSLLESFSRKGDGGSVSLTASGDIQTLNIRAYSEGGGTGGPIALISSSGNVTSSNRFFSNSLESFSNSGTGGDLTVSAAGNVTISGIRSDSQARAGNINITSGDAIDVAGGDINSYSSGSTGGDVTLIAQNDIIAQNISTYGPIESGNVTLTILGKGSINTAAIQTIAPNGTSGTITLLTFSVLGNITTTNIISSGSLGAGDIVIDSAGNVTTKNVSSISDNGSSGDITVEAGGDALAENVTSSGNTGAGNSTVSSGGNATTGNVSSSSNSGAAGDASVTAGKNATTGDVTSSGATNSGNANVSAGENATTGNVSSTANSGSSGNASVTATGNVTAENVTSSGNTGAGNATVSGNYVNVGNVTSTANQGTAGNATVAAVQNATTSNILSSGSTQAGNASVIAGGDAITGNVESISSNGSSGNAIVVASGDVTAGNVRSEGVTGAGNVTVTSSTGSVTSGNVESISSGGDSGNITVAAENNVTTQNIRTSGATGAGDITVTSTAGAVTTGNLESLSASGNSGNIAISAQNDVTAGNISSVGAINSGNISVSSTAGSIATGDVLSQAITGSAGNITVSAFGDINTGDVTSTGALGSGDINFTSQTGQINTGKVRTDTGTITFNGVASEEGDRAILTVEDAANGINPPITGNNQELLANLNLPSLNIVTAIAPDSLIEQMEAARGEEFADYFGEEEIAKQPITTVSLRASLKEIASITGLQSAIAYVNAHPEQLEIVLFTAQGQPIRKSIPAAKRETVLKVIKEFRERVTDPRLRNTTSYLPSAQQLYQWLIAPIEPDLQAQGIDTLLFSMDAGLRSLPLAALHDGKQFLVEKYSLALIPSVSLMDARYQSLQKTQLLAFGASEFAEHVSLPAVPLELKAIAKERQGLAFLNEAFTLDNFKLQRQNHPYQIVHLATHAEFVPGAIANSYIQLWDDKLRLDRLRSLRLNNPAVELLVLSACRTALGNEKAEMGFAGLAVLSGVKSALASLWYVSDVGTLGLMSEFYHNLSSAPIKAEALRHAQLKMIRGELFISEGTLRGLGARSDVALPPELAKANSPNLSHPYYWSAFTMIGSPW